MPSARTSLPMRNWGSWSVWTWVNVRGISTPQVAGVMRSKFERGADADGAMTEERRVLRELPEEGPPIRERNARGPHVRSIEVHRNMSSQAGIPHRRRQPHLVHPQLAGRGVVPFIPDSERQLADGGEIRVRAPDP